MSLYIVQCYGPCKRFTLLLDAKFLEGHVYCEDCAPMGSAPIEAALLAFVIDPVEVSDETLFIDEVLLRMKKRNDAKTS